MTATANQTAQEIVKDGDGYTPDELQRIGDEIINDTRPGIPADEFFRALKKKYQDKANEAPSNAA